MARLTVKKPDGAPGVYGHRMLELGDLMRSTPALGLFVLPDWSVGVWINPEVAAKVDTEDCERMVECVRHTLLACVRPQG